LIVPTRIGDVVPPIASVAGQKNNANDRRTRRIKSSPYKIDDFARPTFCIVQHNQARFDLAPQPNCYYEGLGSVASM